MVGRKIKVAYSVALVVVAVATGCGSDDDATQDAGTVAPSTTASSTTGSAASSAPVDQGSDSSDSGLPVMVEAYDYKFEAIPAEFAAGTQLTLTNLSSSEVHEIVAFRLPDTETRSAAELVALPEAELGALFGGGPATVIVAPPNAEGFAVVGDGVLSEPGRYLFVCTIPTGADPEEFLAAAQASEGPPDVAGGPPHFTKGMFDEAVVS
jgi:hypothetical protein